jgi:hypothetical protein
VGALTRSRDGREIILGARCLLGRSPACHARIDGRWVSAEHARIAWTGSAWRIRDLGSSNGTFVDGRRLAPGELAPLPQGARIGFGDPDDLFEVTDAGAPLPFAVDVVEGTIVRGTAELLALPSESSPDATVYVDPLGSGWLLERSDGGRAPVEDLAIAEVSGRRWRLELPIPDDATPVADASLRLDAVSFRFAVSRDEERVEITIERRGLGTRLEVREHGYLLLTLARARRRDAERPIDDRGWLDLSALSRMLKVDANWIYVATHRARQQLSAIGCQGAAGVVEVSRGKRRFGTDRFEIATLD